MKSTDADRDARVLDWLLDADPSIRWQVMRDLTGEPDNAVAAERARIGTEGWGARLLALQQPDGSWGGGTWVPRSQASTFETLALLRELGLDPEAPQARAAIARVRAGSDWGPEWDHSPFFEGEVEPCINGRTLAIGAYFGEVSDALADRLLGEQLADGGWNCEAPPSTVSSFNSTLCVLEGMLEYERATGSAEARAARERGQEYLLERGLFRSLSSGAPIERDSKSGRDWRDFVFPNGWRYDLLWALDFLRRSGAEPNQRVADAVDVVRRRRGPDGRWTLVEPHSGAVHFHLEGGAGTASRWLTLRALRVLDWYDAA